MDRTAVIAWTAVRISGVEGFCIDEVDALHWRVFLKAGEIAQEL